MSREVGRLPVTFLTGTKKSLLPMVLDFKLNRILYTLSIYLDCNSRQYYKMKQSIDDNNQIYRFSDYGIQKSKDGICFTLKANMGTWYNRVPIIRDDFGIRKITPKECLALQGFPKEFSFPEIPINSTYKQCGNSVVVPLIRQIAENIIKALGDEFHGD